MMVCGTMLRILYSWVAALGTLAIDGIGNIERQPLALPPNAPYEQAPQARDLICSYPITSVGIRLV